MTLRTGLQELWLDLLALLWPTSCSGCGAPDRDCCASCVRELSAPAVLIQPSFGLPCFARAVYAGPTRGLLIAFKHSGMVRFGGVLGGQLRPALIAALSCAIGASGDTRAGAQTPGRVDAGAPRAGPLVVPAPSRPAKARERGYRHVELLVTAALRGRRGEPAVRLPLIRALRTLRGRRGQVGLGPRERARNARLVAVRSRARSALRGRTVVLVDDVLTTGATLLAARDAIERAGGRVVAIAVLCVAVAPEPTAL